MKILQICHKSPFPPNDGGALAMYQLAKTITGLECQVKMLLIETDKHPFNPAGDPLARQTGAEAVYLQTGVTPSLLRIALLDRKNLLIKRFKNQKFISKLINTLHSFDPDIVLLDGAFTGVYFDTIRANSAARIVLRAHNIEHKLWQERLFTELKGIKQKLLRKAVEGLEAFETGLFRQVDAIIPISASDKEEIEKIVPGKIIVHVPFSLELEKSETCEKSDEKRIAFLGALDWAPNVEGLNWFIEEVFPLVRKSVPDAVLHIAGRNGDALAKRAFPEGIVFEGYVESAHRFICSAPVLIAPLFTGSGIRIKIIEAMALERVVVATSTALQGIDATDGVDVLVADDPQAFASKIIRCFEDEAFYVALSANSRKFALNNFSMEYASSKLLELQEIIFSTKTATGK